MTLMQRHKAASRAFTLLEVVLAVALSAVVVYLVAGAIEFHLRQLTVRRTQIEEAQLAREVLRRIADDLRAVVIDRPIDFSSVGEMLDMSADGEGSAGAAGDDELGSSSVESTAESEIVESSLLPETPGVYGNAYELQIDISRIPRYEEYAMLDPVGNLSELRTLSDVKTVSYFLLNPNGAGTGMNSGLQSPVGSQGMGFGAGASTGTSRLGSSFQNGPMSDFAMIGLPPDQPLQGLGRRSLDRSAARYALQNAGYSQVDQQTQLFAPEVTFIQFRYFDGLQWLSEWNSDVFGGIPLAVEIAIALQPSTDRNADGSRSDTQSTSTQTLWQFDPQHVYRLVVYLPAAEPIDTTTSLGGDASDGSEELP